MANSNQPEKHLLIISCSQRKKSVKGKIKAWDLYDGVVFRMLKKIERERGLPHNLDIIILSAKYGFIKPLELIEFYDYRLKKSDTLLRKDYFVSSLKQKINKSKFSKIITCIGKDYLKCIDGFERFVPGKAKIIFVEGGIGSKMSYLKT